MASDEKSDKIYSLAIRLHMWKLWECLACGPQWFSTISRRAEKRKRDDCDSSKGFHDYTVYWALRGWTQTFAEDCHRKIDITHRDDDWATAVLLDPTSTKKRLELPQLEWKNAAFQRVVEGLGFLDLSVFDENMDCMYVASKVITINPGWHPFFSEMCVGDWSLVQEQSILIEENDFEFSIVLSKKRHAGVMLRYKIPALKKYWGLQ